MERILKPRQLAIDPNSPTASKEWVHWKRTFNTYISRYLSAVTLRCIEDDKLAALISYATHEVYEHIDHCTTYTEAVEILEELYGMTINDVTARYKLQSARQEPDQTLEDFRITLEKLAKDCDFKDVSAKQYKENMIRDCFIQGLASPEIRLKLMELKKLTLKEAFNQAVTLEVAGRECNAFGVCSSIMMNSMAPYSSKLLISPTPQAVKSVMLIEKDPNILAIKDKENTKIDGTKIESTKIESTKVEDPKADIAISSPDLFDIFCDPNNPTIVSLEYIKRAQQMIKGGVVRTPLTRSRLSDELGMDLYFKKEFMQFTASFKDRGALYSLLNLTPAQRKAGVVTTSAGNHSQAMAYQCGKLNIPVTVFMPETAPLVKVNSCKKLKANVVLIGHHFDEARACAMEYMRQNNLVYINGYDHHDIIAGQGTVGLEMMEDVPDLDYILVPIGGGGLIAGVTAAVKATHPHVKIIGIESERCPSWTTATEFGRPIRCEKSIVGATNTVADGLAVIQVGINAFATAASRIDRLVRLNENFISLAILRLVEAEKAVVEGAGSAGLAAILSGVLPELKGKKVGCVLCGGNIDATTLRRVIDRGLVMDGRFIKFSCVISDRSGGLHVLMQKLSELRLSIRDVVHERMVLPGAVYKVSVTCTGETLDREHSFKIKQTLTEIYGDEVQWVQLV